MLLVGTEVALGTLTVSAKALVPKSTIAQRGQLMQRSIYALLVDTEVVLGTLTISAKALALTSAYRIKVKATANGIG